MAVVFADRRLPDHLAGLRVDRDDEAVLARPDRQLLAADGGEDRRVLEVPVVDVVRGRLVVPLELAGLRVQLDQRVGVEVGTGPARAPGQAFGAGERHRVAGPDVHPAFFVEGGRVPEAAARVDGFVLLRPERLRHRVPVPFFRAGLRVERPEDAGDAAVVGAGGVGRHGRDVDQPVVHAGRHVDRFLRHRRQFGRPEFLAARRVEREGFRRRRAEDLAFFDRDPVRPLVDFFHLRFPDQFAGFQVEGGDVRFEVLHVDDPVGDDRRGGVRPVGAFRRARDFPGFFQFGRRFAVDRAAGDEAAVGEVDAGEGRIFGDLRGAFFAARSAAPTVAAARTTMTSRRRSPRAGRPRGASASPRRRRAWLSSAPAGAG